MREVGAFSAKTHLSQLLESVSRGESFAITKHGRVVAFLVPAESKPVIEISEAISGIAALRKKLARRGMKLSMKDIKRLKESGRK